MKKIISIIALFALVLPSVSFADTEDADPYADSLTSENIYLYQGELAVGEPDGLYADFTCEDASLTLDMGEGEEGVDDLIVHYYLFDLGATAKVEFKNSEQTTISMVWQAFYIGTSQTFAFDYDSVGQPYRFVKITSTEDEAFKIDAIEASDYVAATTENDVDGDGMPDYWEIENNLDYETNDHAEDTDGDGLLNINEFENNTNPNQLDTDADGYTDKEEVDAATDPTSPFDYPQAEIEEPIVPESTVPERGSLIKLPDDGDAATQHDSSVYVMGEDDKRHSFPSSTIFYTWYQNFDNVIEVDEDTMADITLGGSVKIRPGTNLIKIQSDPKVYTVEPDGVIRWVTTEAIAIFLYGDDWATKIVDIDASFFSRYTTGEPIEAAVHPTSSILRNSSGDIFYVQNGTKRAINDSVFESLNFSESFLLDAEASTLDLYLDGVDMSVTTDIELIYPY